MKHKIAISLNSSWNLVNFRSGLIEALAGKGYDVVGLAPLDSYSKHLKKINCTFIPIKIDTNGRNPFKDLLLFFRYLWVLNREKPHIYLGFTVKPNIYGSLAAHILGIPVINNIAGLGRAFSGKNKLISFITILYKISLHQSWKVFFQNKTDLNTFIKLKIIEEKFTYVLPGSGVNLIKYKPIPKTRNDKKIKFLLVSRLLWEKGINEYVESAKLIKKDYTDIEFLILGFLNENDSQYVPLKYLKEWHRNGIINYLGISDDVRAIMSDADCVVLPSYYKEGTPKTLLEAAALAKPIITSNTPGCNDVVKHMHNGFLCLPKSTKDLTEKMVEFIHIDNNKKSVFGKNSRVIAEKYFDERIIIQKYQKSIFNIIYENEKSS